MSVWMISSSFGKPAGKLSIYDIQLSELQDNARTSGETAREKRGFLRLSHWRLLSRVVLA